MKKKDLKVGMVVELLNGDRCLVLNTGDGLILTDNSSYILLSDYDNDLNCPDDSFKYSIVKVFEIKGSIWLDRLFHDNNLRLIWERKFIERKISKEEIIKVFHVQPYETLVITE